MRTVFTEEELWIGSRRGTCKDVLRFEGGLRDWKDAGCPTEG